MTGWKPAYVGQPFQAAGEPASQPAGVAASRAATLVRRRRARFSREPRRRDAAGPAGGTPAFRLSPNLHVRRNRHAATDRIVCPPPVPDSAAGCPMERWRRAGWPGGVPRRHPGAVARSKVFARACRLEASSPAGWGAGPTSAGFQPAYRERQYRAPASSPNTCSVSAITPYVCLFGATAANSRITRVASSPRPCEARSTMRAR
jgi:hypothetical protein